MQVAETRRQRPETARSEFRFLVSGFCILLCLQFGFWWQTKDIRPGLGIVPDVPGREELHAMAFGDDEFYFRTLAFVIQNCGDTFGRFSPLRYYDLSKLYFWFTLLDELDSKSNMMPSLAAYYFSQTQNVADVHYVADYLEEHAKKDVEHNWWWLIQAIYLTMHKMQDMNKAKEIADLLVNPKVPVWAQQMAAVVYEKNGEMDDAYRIMMTIRKNATNISDADLKYMTYFVEERLSKLDKNGKRVQNGAPAPAGLISPAPAHP